MPFVSLVVAFQLLVYVQFGVFLCQFVFILNSCLLYTCVHAVLSSCGLAFHW